MANYRLKAYESFILRDGWVTKGLNSLCNNPKLFQENSGADQLGVGTNMAKAIRYWLKAADLIEEKANKGTFISELGNIILEKDPYIEDPFSILLIHCNIARNETQATSWNLFFNNLDISSFTRAELENMMMNLLIEKTGELKLPERSVKEDCGAILSMYCIKGDENLDPEEKKMSPFAPLQLISLNGNVYEKTPVSTELASEEIVMYLIADTLNANGSLLIDDIVLKDNMAGKILNLNRIMINDYLDKLEEKQFITVNRTAGLDVVYPQNSCSANELVRKYYEGI